MFRSPVRHHETAGNGTTIMSTENVSLLLSLRNETTSQSLVKALR